MSSVASGRVAGLDRTRLGADQGRRPLDSGWQVCSTRPDACADPQALEATRPAWLPASVPGTVAGAWRAASGFDWADTPDLDEQDHWFRLTLRRGPEPETRTVLAFDGVATLGEVWLDDERLFETDNMFLEYRHDVSDILARKGSGSARLYLCCRNLTGYLAERRPRARWRSALVAHRNLRWLRTSLLGRMPGICPPAPVVGPWREVWLLEEGGPALESLSVVPELIGDQGRVTVRGRYRVGNPERHETTVVLELGEQACPLTVQADDGAIGFAGTMEIDGPELWWPHTHGRPHRYPAALRIAIDGVERRVPLAAVGFRRFAAGEAGGAFGLSVNGVDVFCRGACWTPADFLGQAPDREALRIALERVVAAGMNMLRIPGNTVYEHDVFYELCDEYGVMVWQDLMFANMDYPFDDEGFLAGVHAEVGQQLARLGHRPCLAVLCGCSEVQQQAAMLGLPESTWRVDWFERDLAGLCQQQRPDVAYVPGSPSGGILPFHLDAGPGHYFGVGGYRRPVADAWLAEPRFASECLAFGVPPEPGSPDATATDLTTLLARTPRDAGADWDFVDICEYYARAIYGADVERLRREDPARHGLVCRAAAGETMSRVQAIWRRPEAVCRGALVWFLRDFWPSAGWGLEGADGSPKSSWFHLKRCWQPRALMFLDRGLNGLRVLVTNDAGEPLSGRLSVSLERFDGVAVASGELALSVPARSVREVAVEQVVGSFVDSAYAYRFGPAGFDLVHAAIETAEGPLTAVHVRDGALPADVEPGQVEVASTTGASGDQELLIGAEALLHTVVLEMPGALPSDNYFHVAPGRPRRVTLRRTSASGKTPCRISALNLAGSPLEIGVDVGAYR